ncbi:MAG TPA: hypothetical protein DCP92_11005 [Nitrospiraceae bacterium]|nr:hypothetical protein [Nitrospiraceae bacterium]
MYKKHGPGTEPKIFWGIGICQGLIRAKYIDVVVRGSETEVGSLRPFRQRIIFILCALILMGAWCSED